MSDLSTSIHLPVSWSTHYEKAAAMEPAATRPLNPEPKQGASCQLFGQTMRKVAGVTFSYIND